MEYPFKFDEIILTDRIITLLGFGEYCDGAGDFGTRQINLNGMTFCLVETDEKDDSCDGYSYPYDASYVAGQYYTEDFEQIYFLHELYEYIKRYNSKTALDEFITRCKKINLMPYIKSYLEYLNSNEP